MTWTDRAFVPDLRLVRLLSQDYIAACLKSDETSLLTRLLVPDVIIDTIVRMKRIYDRLSRIQNPSILTASIYLSTCAASERSGWS
jgi:hypothetical protein